MSAKFDAEAEARRLAHFAEKDDIHVALVAAYRAGAEAMRERALTTALDAVGGPRGCHACSSCGLTDEEWERIDGKREARDKMLAAIRALPIDDPDAVPGKGGGSDE